MIPSTVIMDTIGNMLIGYEYDLRRSADKEATANNALDDIRALLDLQDESMIAAIEEFDS